MKRASTSGRRSGDPKRLRNEAECDLPEVAEFEDDLTQTLNRSTAAAGLAPTSCTGSDVGEPSAVQTMTADEINEHVLKCLEMSSENKITPKNAFALQLIDCLKYLVDKKKDFSTMACSLDAGAKIYSYRVDALHQKVITLAEEVMKNLRKKQSDVDKDGEGTETTVRRLSRKSKGILTSNETIVRRLKRVDPKDKYLKVTALPGSIISGVRLDNRDLSFTLENKLAFWPDYTNYKPTRAEGSVILPKIEVVRDSSRIAFFDCESNNLTQNHGLHSQECSVNRVKHQHEDDPLYHNHPEETPLPGTNHDVENQPEDSPRSPASNAIDPVEDGLGDASDQEDTGDKGVDEVDVLATAMRRLNEEAQGGMCPPPTRAEAIKMLFDNKSEYHYLDMKNVKYWAGPDYWTRSQHGPSSAENNKRSRGRKKKEPGLLEYDFEDLEEEWSRGLRPGSKLTCNKVKSWKPSSTMTPKDLRYDLDTFTDLFHMTLKEVMEKNRDIIESHGSDYNGPQDSVEFVDVDNGISSLRQEDEQDPLNSIKTQDDDVNYEHDDSSQDEVDVGDGTCDIPPSNLEINGRGRLIKINVDSDNTPGYDDASLVPAPKMVTVKPIQFKSRPIRVDMRHLKEVMLDQIKKDFENDGCQKTTFSRLLGEIPHNLEKTTAQDLSPSMAFLALLTLATENNLRIKSCDNHQDAIVTMMEDVNYNRVKDTDKLEHHIIDMVNELP